MHNVEAEGPSRYASACNVYPLERGIVPLSPREAKAEFLGRYRELTMLEAVGA